MGTKPSDIRVDVILHDGSTALGHLTANQNGVGVALEGQSEASSNRPIMACFLDEDQIPIHASGKRIDRSVFFELPAIQSSVGYYSEEDLIGDEMYPRSSNGWIKRRATAGVRAFYSVHRVRESGNYLLIIAGIDTGLVYECIIIKEFERHILTLTNDSEFLASSISNASQMSKIKPEPFLVGPAPHMSAFEQLVTAKKAHVDFSYKAESLEQTVDSLVPQSFPEHIREQIKAFYAFVVTREIPKEDPLDLFFYASHSLLMGLVREHITCLLSGKEPPNYVEIFYEADSGNLPPTYEIPLVGEVKPPAWVSAFHRIYENVPKDYSRTLRIIRSLEESKTIPAGMPATKAMAKKSQESWADRFSIISHGLMMRATIDQRQIGLRHLLYLGSAYRWPHKHTAWSARIHAEALDGAGDHRPWFLQVMIMSPNAIAKAKDEGTGVRGVLEIDWSTYISQHSQFQENKNQWKFSIEKVVDSLAETATEDSLKKSLGIPPFKRVVGLSEIEAKILGLASRGMYLDNLEVGVYNKYLGISKGKLIDTLQEMMKKKILRMHYSGSFPGLYSLLLRVRKKQAQINSFTKTIASQAATATIYKAKDAEECIIIARVPRAIVPELTLKLPSAAEDVGMDLSVYPVAGYSAYKHSIYSRLRIDAQTWDDDITGFVSQHRR